MKAFKTDVTPRAKPVYETVVNLSDREIEIVRIALEVVFYQKLEERGVSREEADEAHRKWVKMSTLRVIDGLQEIK